MRRRLRALFFCVLSVGMAFIARALWESEVPTPALAALIPGLFSVAYAYVAVVLIFPGKEPPK